MSGWLAIVNRRAGGNGARARLPNILRDLSDFVEKTVFTEHPGHAAELAKEATSYSGLASVGGDGTLFEILNGLDRKRQRVAIIPAGRGNSLARDLGLLSRPLTLDVIDVSNPLPIDLMEVTFKNAGGLEAKCNSASTVALGYPASVTKTARGFPRRLGAFCYATAAALVRPVPFDIEILQEDGSRKKTRLRCFIANNTRHVANFLVFPEASCRDGFIHLLELDAGFLGQTIHNVSGLLGSSLFRRNHLGRAKSINLGLQEPQELMIDGELFPEIVSVRIQILPMALECVLGGVASWSARF